MKTLAITLCAALAVLSACARPVEPGVTELTYASPYGPTHPFSRADQSWIDFVEAESQGRLRIRPVWSGVLLSSDMSMEELRHGVADIGLITPIYVRGGTHLIRAQSGFYSGADSMEAQLALYECIAAADPQIERELHGLKVLAVQGGALPGLITRNRPVSTLEDLRGLRIRAPTELLTVLESLGADPVNMPMGEVYSALAKGVLDGVAAPPDTFQALHFADVAQYYNTLAIPRGAYPARAMAQRRWDTLSEADQRVLEDARAVWEAALAEEIPAATERGLAEAQAKGVIITLMSPVEQERFDRLYLRDAETNARALQRFGVDGMRAFAAARASITGRNIIDCGSGTP